MKHFYKKLKKIIMEIINKEVLPVQDKITPKFDIASILELQKLSSKNIALWIKSHPYFKWTRMCQSIGIDKGYFSRAINSESPCFKLEEIPAIENELSNYGYNN